MLRGSISAWRLGYAPRFVIIPAIDLSLLASPLTLCDRSLRACTPLLWGPSQRCLIGRDVRAARPIPVRTLAPWADEGFPVLVPGQPLVPAPLASVSPKLNFRHTRIIYRKENISRVSLKGIAFMRLVGIL